MDNSLFEFLSKLEESSIPYVVWKGSHEIGKCLDRGSDLDIFIPEHETKDKYYETKRGIDLKNTNYPVSFIRKAITKALSIFIKNYLGLIIKFFKK